MAKRARLTTSFRFDAASVALRIVTGAMTETITVVVVAQRDYFLSGNGEADDINGNGDFLTMLQTALNTNGGGGVYTVTVSSDGVVTVACTASFELLFTDGATTLDPALLGFIAADVGPTSSATGTLTADSWWAPDLDIERTDWGEPNIKGASKESANGVLFAWSLGQADGEELGAMWGLIKLAHTRKRFAVDAGDPSNCIEFQWIDSGMHAGNRFRLYEFPQSTLDMSDAGNHVGRLMNTAKQRLWKQEGRSRRTTYSVKLKMRTE